ncbi:MAG: D-alanyl-D-alanine carboxypeptidase/D-alanyl-D-alanine-endopeptidase, partial [Pseudomonadota bacterium]
MQKLRGLVGLFCGIALSGLCAGQLPPEMSQLLRERNLPEDALGAVVLRLSDGKTVFTHRAEKALQPASTMKVLTAIVGLERLGPAYRSRTELWSAATIDQGVLKGDLVLRGLGDTDFNWEDLQRMLQRLRHRGITEIQGDLIVDRRFFQPGRLDVGLPPFDESPEFRYNVIPDALLINTNLVQLEIETNNVGIQIRQTPPLDRVSVMSNMTFSDRVCEKWEDDWKIPSTVIANNGEIRVYLNGRFPKNCAQTVSINVIDRADFMDRLFRTLWRDLGGAFNGKLREADAAAAPTGMTLSNRLLAEHRARPLAEVTRNINKISDNTITRTIYLTLGTLDTTSATVPTLKKAEAEIRSWLKQHAIDDADLVLENGSGLSRTERIKPAQ